MKWKPNKMQIIAIILVAVVIIAVGIGLVYNAFYSSYYSLRGEHEQHLQDLAWSTDRNVGMLIRGVTDELSYGIAHNDKIEKEYLLNRDEAAMRKAMSNSLLMDKSFVSGVQLLQGNEIIMCVNKGGACEYTYPFGWTTDAPSICTDSKGNEYFAIVSKSPGSDLYYAVLIDLNDFYERISGVEISGDYWLVLYDLNTGVLLQNDDTNPKYTLIGSDEALDRKDGIGIIAEAELNQELIIESYQYKSDSLQDKNHLIAVLPSESTDNGIFAIGVAMGMTHLSDLLNIIFDKIVLSGVLCLVGLSVLLLLIYYNRRSNADLQEKLQLLDKENKEMAELAHHQRLEMIGTMTSGIAHEFNNMLTPIMGYSIMAMEKLPAENEELLDELGEIYTASERAKTLISRLSELSRKKSSENSTLFSPDKLLEKVCSMAKPSLPAMVELRKEYNCPEECLFANETEIGQLLLNIIINAFQALDKYGGGVFTISTSRLDGRVIIRLHNTGPGIAAEYIPKLFDPFFTTKEIGQGTGLGLAIAKQIAENYGGDISVESSDAIGTAFIVNFPDASK